MNSDAGNTPSRVLGFPIRTPSDHSSFGNSPRLIAAYYVLHRLLVPRHPPCALTHLQTQNNLKMLASTVQFSNNTHQPHPHPATQARLSRESVPPETTLTRYTGKMVLFQTPNSVLHPDPTPPTSRPLSRLQRDQHGILRDSVPPNEPPGAPHSGTNQAQTLTTHNGVVSAP